MPYYDNGNDSRRVTEKRTLRDGGMGVGMVSETIANGHHWSPTCTVGAAPSIRSGTIGWTILLDATILLKYCFSIGVLAVVQ